MRTLIRIVVIFVLCAAIVQVSNAQADNMCPRGVYVNVFAFKDIGGDKEDLVPDPDFTIQKFLDIFGKFFASPRLSFKPSIHPEYSLTATFIKINGRPGGGADKSLLAIAFSFMGGEISDESRSIGGQFGSDRIYYSFGANLLVVTSKAGGHDPASHVPMIQAELKKETPLDDIIVGYEQIPISAHTDDTLSCQYEPTYPGLIYFDSFKAAAPVYRYGAVPYAHYVRIVARAQNGSIENGEPIKEDPSAKAFHFSPTDLSRWKEEIHYVPPGGDDKSDVLTLYNSCDICYEWVVPLNETKKHSKLAEIKIDCRREWDVNYTFTEQLSYTSPELKTGRQYSLTVKGRVHFKKHDRIDDVYESDSATIELSDNINQHMTYLNMPQHPDTHYHVTWTANKNGQVPMKIRLVFNTYSHKYSLFIPPWQGDPVVVKGVYQWDGVINTPDGAREFTCRAIVDELPTHGFMSQLDPDWGPDPPEGVPYKEGQTVLSGEFANVHEMGWAVGCPCASPNLEVSPPPIPILAGMGLGIVLQPQPTSHISKPYTKSVKWEIRKGQ